MAGLPLNVNVLEQERVNQRVALCQSLMASNPQSDKYKYENQHNSSISRSSTVWTRLGLFDSICGIYKRRVGVKEEQTISGIYFS